MSRKTKDEIQIPKPIKRVIEKTQELDKEVKKVGKKSIKDLFKAIFKKYPEVTALQWTQFTPHFNDGDACVFTVHEIRAQFKEGVVISKGDPESEHSKEDTISDGEDSVYTYEFSDTHPEIAAAIDEIYEVFQSVEGTLRAVFGDGVEVTVTPKEVEVEEYDHD